MYLEPGSLDYLQIGTSGKGTWLLNPDEFTRMISLQRVFR
jgi:hypothetical protein